jgi:tetratricopeptide (TPR) repeat protein
VRTAAVSPLELLPHPARLEALGPLLEDPIRAVRSETARALAAVPRDAFDPDLRRAFDAALAEFEAAQLAQADQPAAHLNLAVVAAARGETERALAEYRTALRLDPGFVPARVNLANLYNALDRNADAERELRAALAVAPEQGELHYSLGLLLAEERRYEEAEAALARAAEHMPGRPRVRYNRGLALQRLGRAEAAETELLAAHAIAPDDPVILYAVVVLLVQTESFDRALPYAEQLVVLAPGAPGPQRLLERVRGGANSPADGPP